MILFLVLVLVAGKSFVEETLSAGQNFIIFAIIQSLTFAAGVYIILAGVRMVIAEIVPAFKGIADKLVKDAKPALDCPTVFPFARMPSSSASSQALSQGWSVCSSARCSA